MKSKSSFGVTTPNGYYLEINTRDVPYREKSYKWDGKMNQNITVSVPVKQNQKRLYIWPKGESAMENFLEGRYNRPVDFYRKEVLPTIKKLFNIDRNTEISWSQKAGCSCPCSPGFIIKDHKFFNMEERYDINVTVS